MVAEYRLRVGDNSGVRADCIGDFVVLLRAEQVDDHDLDLRVRPPCMLRKPPPIVNILRAIRASIAAYKHQCVVAAGVGNCGQQVGPSRKVDWAAKELVPAEHIPGEGGALAEGTGASILRASSKIALFRYSRPIAMMSDAASVRISGIAKLFFIEIAPARPEKPINILFEYLRIPSFIALWARSAGLSMPLL